MESISFKPSEVGLFRSFLPFIDTFKHSEVELAAGILVATMVYKGDVWESIGNEQIREWMEDEKQKGEYWSELFKNPFARPDFYQLVDDGWAVWEGEPAGKESLLRLTQATFNRLVEKNWVKK